MQEMQRDVGLIPESRRSPGGEQGHPFQHSCLENPMDGGSWQATVHSTANSWRRLKGFSMRANCSVAEGIFFPGASEIWESRYMGLTPCQISPPGAGLFQPRIKSTKRSLQAKRSSSQISFLQQLSPSPVHDVQDLGTEHPECVGGHICIEVGGQGLSRTSKNTSKHTQEGKFLHCSGL